MKTTKDPSELVNQDEFDAVFALGANFFAQGQYRKAKSIFDGLVAISPDNHLALCALKECLERLRREADSAKISCNTGPGLF